MSVWLFVVYMVVMYQDNRVILLETEALLRAPSLVLGNSHVHLDNPSSVTSSD